MAQTQRDHCWYLRSEQQLKHQLVYLTSWHLKTQSLAEIPAEYLNWCLKVECHLMSVHQKQLPRKTSKQFNSKTVCVWRCDTTWCVSFPLLSVIHTFKMLDTHVKQCPKFCITRWVYASQIFKVQTDLKSQFCTVFFLFLSLSDVKEQWLCKWAAVLFKPSLCKGQPIKGKLSESLH